MLETILLAGWSGSMILLFCQSLSVACSVKAVLLVQLLVYAASYRVNREIQKEGITFGAAMLLWYGVLAILSLLLSGFLVVGAKGILVTYLKLIRSYYKVELGIPSFSGSGLFIGSVLFLTFLGTILIPFFHWANEKKTAFRFFLIVTVFAVVLCLLVGCHPGFLATVTASACLLFYRVYIVEEKSVRDLTGKMVVFCAVSLLILGSAGIAVNQSGILSEKHQSYMQVQSRLEEKYGFATSADYQTGNLSNLPPKRTHQTMLHVKLEYSMRSPLYLRGFTGESYEGGHWEAVDAAGFYKNNPKLGANHLKQTQRINDAGFTVIDHLSAKTSGNFKIKISYYNAPGNYLYAPYFAQSSFLEDGLKENGDGTLLRENNNDIVLPFYNNAPSFFYAEGGSLPSSYGRYVKKHYLSVPADLKTKLLHFLNDPDTKEMSLGEAMDLIKSRLDEECVYSTSLTPLSVNEDYVEHFLKEKKGYCTHFATTAVLALRSLGYPARYVTGYEVKEKDIRQIEGSSLKYFEEAQVTDDQAHAWAEVYHKDLGWIPFETTPGSDDPDQLEDLIPYDLVGQKEETETTSEQQATTEQSQQTDTTVQAATTEQSNAKQQKASSKTASYAIWFLKWMFAIIVLGVLLFFGVRGYRMWQYRKRHQPDCKKAIEAVKRQMMRKLKRKRQEKEADETEKEYLLRVLPEISYRYVKVEQEQRYSEEELRALAKDFYEILERLTYGGKSMTKKDVQKANLLYDQIFPY